MSSSSASRNWVYDVFPSFRGEDVRKGFLSHFLKELDRKLISAFKDKKIETSESLDPVLKKAIKDSRIAIVIFSQNYASSGWCLNELLEIVKYKQELIVIPVFYKVDPCDVRYQIGEFGKVFENTCLRKTEDEIKPWRDSLKEVANLVGYHSQAWENDATMIEKIANDVLGKLDSNLSKDFEDFVGIENHITEMNLRWLPLESKEVRMVGIQGPSGVGKTTIARALYSRLSHHFQGKIYIDKYFISKSIKDYSNGNMFDTNMKFHLQEIFLSNILDKDGIKVDHLGAVRERLRNHKVLIFIDDLDNQAVLNAVAGEEEWFGHGSLIVAITIDKQILRGHGIKDVYEVDIPAKNIALQMLCRSAFKKNSPPACFMGLASEIVDRVGRLPLALNILGLSLRERDKKFWESMLSTLRKGLDGQIEKALSISYHALERKEHKELFRYIACFFNGDEINYIKLMLAGSELNVDIGLEILVDKSLIQRRPSWNNTDIVEMHCLVQEMGKEIVRSQSDEPGTREFLIDSKDVCNVLKGCSGTGKIVGISMNLDEVDKVRIHENAFEGMSNLRFLKFYKSSMERKKEVRWHLPKRFNGFPDELKLLSWPGYPLTCLPSNFCPESLVELRMPNSKLVNLWEDAESLEYLKDMDLSESKDLEEISDLSEATNLETLNLHGCSSLVELPSSIQNLDKLTDLNLAGCTMLEDLPDGINMQSLTRLIVTGCSNLKVFPNISSKIESFIANKTAFKVFPSKLGLENLVELRMEHIMSDKLWEGVQPLTSLVKIVLSGSENLKEIPNLSMATNLETLNLNGCSSLMELTLSSIQNLNKLTTLEMEECSSLETLPSGLNLNSLYRLDLNGCSRLRSFPDISSKIANLYLNKTGIEEVPPWISKYSRLEALEMWECRKLKSISPRIFKLENLFEVFFSDCEYLAEISWHEYPPEEAEDTNDTCTELTLVSFTNCLNLNQETFIQQSVSKYLILPGVQVPTYFTHRSNDSTFTIPLHHFSVSQHPFLDFKACVVVSQGSETVKHKLCFIDIEVHCRFIDNNGNYLEPAEPIDFSLPQTYDHLIIFDCRFCQNEDNCESICSQVEIELSLVSTGLRLIECGIKCQSQ